MKLLATTEQLAVIITMREAKMTWAVVAQKTNFTASQLQVIRQHQLKVARPDMVLAIGPSKGENRYQDRAKTVSAELWATFDDYAADSGNWSGTPLVNDWPSERKALNALHRLGLLSVSVDEGHRWIFFTDAGKAMAAERGHPIGH